MTSNDIKVADPARSRVPSAKIEEIAESAKVAKVAKVAKIKGSKDQDQDRNGGRSSGWGWLTAIVLGHLAVSIVHGTAHSGAHVPLSPAANVFVFGVIVAGPLVGLALAWRSERIGSWVIAATMAGAFVFGFVNHFALAGPDHVSQVAESWRMMFTTTAVLLAATEAFASALAFRIARS